MTLNLPQPHTEKATHLVAFHLIPLGLAFLGSLGAIYGLLNQLRQQPDSLFYSQETAHLAQPVNNPSLNASLAPFFTQEVLLWKTDIYRWAVQYEIDPNLIAIVMQIESCGNPSIVSQAGALGLFQVMPYHFTEGENPLDPNINATRGLRYLVRAMELAQGDVSRAMAGYNGGHSIIDWNSHHWSLETNRYVYWATGIYADVKNGAGESPRLAEWLAAGGSSLCSRASKAINS